jgi:glyoxylase-like metal-dependent hydrolase (beta-lactamase superfamily II)
MQPFVHSASLVLALLACSTISSAPEARAALEPPAPMTTSVEFPMWINGADCATEPKIQIFAFDSDTYILRQSMCTDYEGNFLYLLFGQDKVLLEDTGASASPPIPLYSTVKRIIDRWLANHGMSSIPLVVAHSHSHGDHVAGDNQFIGKPNTTVVGTSVSSVQNFFGITSWPTEITTFDLGGRILDVIPIPGHQTAHIAFYDRNTKVLLTGDTLYAGRLYIQDFPAYVQSVQRLVDFTAANEVSYVLGTHIEMQNVPGQQFPLGSTFHPNEHVLQLRRSHLVELLNGVLGMQGAPHHETHDDFIIWPL